MHEERREKQVIRGLWLETLTSFAEAYPDDAHPLYVTLSGAEAIDIQLLVTNGLVAVEENGAIALRHRHRVVAVENRASAVVALATRFPGLKIIEQPFQNLLRSESPVRWPDGEHADLCCARVINLDLNEPLGDVDRNGQLTFPVVEWIAKLGQIHAQKRLDWTLCLTLHGEITWGTETSKSVAEFLLENFALEPAFRDQCHTWLGAALFERIDTADPSFATLSTEEQQRILMVFVPKKIAQVIHDQGWSVSVSRNLRYGGRRQQAPMVSWIMNFQWDPRASRRPQALYREALREILTGAGKVEEDGRISA